MPRVDATLVLRSLMRDDQIAQRLTRLWPLASILFTLFLSPSLFASNAEESLVRFVRHTWASAAPYWMDRLIASSLNQTTFSFFFFALPSFVARFCFILFQLQTTDLFLCLVFRWLSATFTCIYRLSYSRLINGFEDNNRTRKRERERENSCILLQNLTRKRRKETLNLLTKETKVYEWILSVTSHSLDYST